MSKCEEVTRKYELAVSQYEGKSRYHDKLADMLHQAKVDINIIKTEVATAESNYKKAQSEYESAKNKLEQARSNGKSQNEIDALERAVDAAERRKSSKANIVESRKGKLERQKNYTSNLADDVHKAKQEEIGYRVKMETLQRRKEAACNG